MCFPHLFFFYCSHHYWKNRRAVMTSVNQGIAVQEMSLNENFAVSCPAPFCRLEQRSLIWSMDILLQNINILQGKSHTFCVLFPCEYSACSTRNEVGVSNNKEWWRVHCIHGSIPGASWTNPSRMGSIGPQLYLVPQRCSCSFLTNFFCCRSRRGLDEQGASMLCCSVQSSSVETALAW